ncbi:uncharacterized protein F4812DRAFT_49630 [Daldinia caldariorum]|uniref:uncharacterized protein n=1 Tax=Daldinia caldariorum TaxID=326644 RepID=UPI00200790E4|nr:uncharacterized protein F4812DRAFT_49630 [Daldinia caldariorum]KAI1467112.1 hypothetical protein F4812DRAFT_49630 [Daldinia caldariorum]
MATGLDGVASVLYIVCLSAFAIQVASKVRYLHTHYLIQHPGSYLPNLCMYVYVCIREITERIILHTCYFYNVCSARTF